MKPGGVVNNNKLIADLSAPDYLTRWFAAEVLGTRKDVLSSQQKRIMRTAMDSDVGEVLIWGLGQMKAAGSESLIEKFLEHRIDYFRWRAVEALRDLGTKRARGILEKFLDKSRSAETRWKCAWALGDLGHIESFDVLWKHFEDKDRYVRWKSVWALSILKGNVDDRIRQKLQSGVNDYRAWRCLWVLGQIGNEKTLSFLKSIDKENLYPSGYVNYQLGLAVKKIVSKRNEK